MSKQAPIMLASLSANNLNSGNGDVSIDEVQRIADAMDNAGEKTTSENAESTPDLSNVDNGPNPRLPDVSASSVIQGLLDQGYEVL